jgi:hypothetical protein
MTDLIMLAVWLYGLWLARRTRRNLEAVQFEQWKLEEGFR